MRCRDKSFESDASVAILTLESADGWIEKDVEALKDEFIGEAGHTLIQMIPQRSELEWATVRVRIVAEHLNLDISEFVGAKISDGKGWGYILWVHEHKECS